MTAKNPSEVTAPDPHPGRARPGTDPIGDAMRWYADRTADEARQHRVKAQFHLDAAAELDMKAIEYRAMARTVQMPLR